MKLNKLKQLVQEYDNRKGLRRRLFGDALSIRVLKELIIDEAKKLEATSDLEITLQEYQDFAAGKGYVVDLSDNYLASKTASAQVFRQWKFEQSLHESTTLRMTTLQPIQNDITAGSNRINVNRLNFDIQPQQIVLSERVARQAEQHSFYTPLNRFRLFQHSAVNRADIVRPCTYTTVNDAENEGDDSFNPSPRCAPAA